jgi:arylsulfatase A-like enzyme
VRKNIFLCLVSLLLFVSCKSAAPAATTVPPEPAPTIIPSLSFTSAALVAPGSTPLPAPTETPPPLERVVLVSLDGLGARFVTPETMPFLSSLAAQGASAQEATTVMPSVTLPSHVSMLTGMCTENHGVVWNDFRLGYPQAEDLFELAHNAGLRTMMLVAKYKLHQISEPQNVDRWEIRYQGDASIMEAAMDMTEEDFNLFFIHLSGGDDFGHTQGWDSPAQLENFTAADALLESFVSKLEALYCLQSTLLIITADHGGSGYNHGNPVPEDMLIPWIAYGWRTQTLRIHQPVSTTDTAPTIAWALGLALPDTWDGSPIYEAFGDPTPRQSTECSWP